METARFFVVSTQLSSLVVIFDKWKKIFGVLHRVEVIVGRTRPGSNKTQCIGLSWFMLFNSNGWLRPIADPVAKWLEKG